MNKKKPTARNDKGQPMAACVFIQSDDGKILAVSRKDDPNDFGMPGGKVDEGETPEEAAKREVKEETGLDVHNLRHVYDRFDGGHCTYTFVGEADGTIDTEEFGVIRWVTPNVLLTQSRYAPYNRALFARLGIKVDDQVEESRGRMPAVVKLSTQQVKDLIREEVERKKGPLTAYQALEMVHKDHTYLKTPARLVELFTRLENENFDSGYDAGWAAALRAEHADVDDG